MSFTTWAPVKLTIISPLRVSSPAGYQGRIIPEIESKGNSLNLSEFVADRNRQRRRPHLPCERRWLAQDPLQGGSPGFGREALVAR
jgi:hypothetical protein